MRPSLDEWTAITDGVSERAIAAAAGVNLKTVRRWRDGSSRMPHAAAVLLRIHFRGELPPRALPLWHGWNIGHDRLLYAPDIARGFAPSDLYQLHWLMQARAWKDARSAINRRAGESAASALCEQAAVPSLQDDR